MHIIGSYEAKTKLAELLRFVEAGEEVVITRHNQPIARIIPERPNLGIKHVIKSLKILSGKISKGKSKQSIKEMINEGRKY